MLKFVNLFSDIWYKNVNIYTSCHRPWGPLCFYMKYIAVIGPAQNLKGR